jgi:hypothetical protein
MTEIEFCTTISTEVVQFMGVTFSRLPMCEPLSPRDPVCGRAGDTVTHDARTGVMLLLTFSYICLKTSFLSPGYLEEGVIVVDTTTFTKISPSDLFRFKLILKIGLLKHTA